MNERFNAALEAITEHDRITGTVIGETVLRILEACAIYGDPERQETDETRLADSIAELCELASNCDNPKLLGKTYCYLADLWAKEKSREARNDAEKTIVRIYIKQRTTELLKAGSAKSKAEALAMACSDYGELREKLLK